MTDSKNIIQAYEFKPGSIYVIEVKTSSNLTLDTLYDLKTRLKEKDIEIIFIMTDGSDFSMQAVPAVEATHE